VSSTDGKRPDQMVMAAFVSASTTKTSLGAWMHPSTDLGFLTADYYISLAKTLEKGGFDLMFFDDRLAMPAAYQNSIAGAVERGARAVKLDLIAILGLLAGHTSRIGLGATYSTTYSQPYHVARKFATLDHLSNGRAVWNVVTSLNVDEAENFGVDYTEHGDRYDFADQFLEVCTGLWESWQQDALELDRESGVFADPDKVRPLNYKGSRYSSKGPLTVPRPPQGWPMLLQAGQSPRGRDFGARWADMMFVSSNGIEAARKQYADQQERFVAAGRPRHAARLLPSVQVIVGETEELARAKEAYYDSFIDSEEELIYVSEQASFDFSTVPLDEPLDDELLDKVGGTRGLVEKYFGQTRAMFGEQATLRDLGVARARRANIRFVGSATQVADEMEEWFTTEACDGFVLQATDVPGSYEDMARLLMPELRRRGLVSDGSGSGTCAIASVLPGA
jgi:FMN-dependent oxidoreductase (nitrilotriacetate monooxygenase family)